jgi:methylenetetrahydrofolate reductase (NADPH)
MNRTTAPTLSIELFPPKDEKGEEKLWAAIERLREIHPDFVSVTYGAGGSTRDRTIRIAEEFTAKTGISTVAHLTCVGSTRTELLSILDHYQASGISSILALRGDPTGGPRANWVSYPDGFDHADQLVELAARRGGFTIGVAAFPDGHPASDGNFEQDIEVLLRKEELGASFATTQFSLMQINMRHLLKEFERVDHNFPSSPESCLSPISNNSHAWQNLGAQ